MSNRVLPAAVGYVRMSRDVQTKSPEQQREHVFKLAAKLGCRIIRWYEDLGISGDDIKRRTAFRQMVADATNKKDFGLILCWSQDRFGRFDSIDAGEWVAPLRRSGVRLVTVADGEFNWSDTAGRLIYSIQQEGKNTFLLDFARSSTRGRLVGAQRIGGHAGRLPYGYDKLIFDERGRLQRRLKLTDKFLNPRDWSSRLVPSENPTVVNTLRWIFRAYANGLSVRAIAHRLNARGIPSALDCHWRRTTIRNMLHNPVYIGDQVWNRLHVGKYFGIVGGDILSHSVIAEQDGKQVHYRRNRSEDWVVVKSAHPALVSRKLFRRVQARLEQRRGRPFQRPGFALTGLVYCAHCGASMHSCPFRRVYKGTTYHYRRYVCPSSRVKGPTVCPTHSIDEPRLLGFLLKVLQDQVLGIHLEDRLSDHIAASFARHRAARPNELNRLTRRMERLDEQIDQGTSNLQIPADQVQLAASKLSRWLWQRSNVASRIAEIQVAKAENVKKLVADAMCEARRLRFGLLGTDRFVLHHTLKQLISRITLWFEPNPAKPKQRMFSRGLLVVRLQLSNGTLYEDSIRFSAVDLGRRQPPGDIAWRAEKSKVGAECAQGEFAKRMSECYGLERHGSRLASIEPHLA